MTHPVTRPGFAMLCVLWVLAVVGGVALVAAGEGRVGVDAARHRISIERGTWLARGCLAEARARLDRTYVATREGEPRVVWWRSVGRVLAQVRRADDACDVVIEPLGLRLDLNAADLAALTSVLWSAGTPDTKLAATAILDWRDADDESRLGGSEATWYRAEGRPLPRNAAFESVGELRLVRGVDDDSTLQQFFDVDPSRVSLLHASPVVLAALPGFTPAIVRYVQARRVDVTGIADLHDLVGQAPLPDRDGLLRSFASLTLRATLDPDGWRLVARVRPHGNSHAIAVEQVVIRVAGGLHVTRERTW